MGSTDKKSKEQKRAKRLLLRQLRSQKTVCLSTVSLEVGISLAGLKAAMQELVAERNARQLESPVETYSYS